MTDATPGPRTCSNCLTEGLSSPFCPHCGSPTYIPSREVVPASHATVAARPSKRSPGNAWLTDNAIFQSINAGVFGGLIAGWIAIGASLAGATTAACAFCLVVPVIGWFFGLPMVLMFGMAAAMFWIVGLFMIVGAWMVTAAAVAAVSFGHRLLESRSRVS